MLEVPEVPRPFEGSYGVSLTTAILALIPSLLVTSAYVLYHEQVSHDLGAGPTGLEIVNGIATLCLWRAPRRRPSCTVPGCGVMG